MSSSNKSKNLCDVNSFTWISSIVLILIISCSNPEEVSVPDEIAMLENLATYASDTQPKYEVSLEPEAVFGDTENVLLSSRISATVDDRGRVFIADYQQIVLHFYNPDGTYNRQVGQEGEGPGEYRRIGSMHAGNEYLHLMDTNLNRITRYDLDTFEVEGDVSLSVDRGETKGYIRYPQTFYVQNDTTYLLQLGTGFSAGEAEEEAERTIEGRTLNINTGETGEATLFSFPAPEALVHREGNSVMVMSVPYNRKSVISVQDGQIIHGWSEDFLLKIYDENGHYQRAIYYPYKNATLDRNKVLEIYSDSEEQWQDMVRGDDMPETWPMFDSFTVDDEGRIWIKKHTENREEFEYAVLASSGELLATFPWPADNRIEEIEKGFLYSLETEEETGLKEVVKYRVSFEEV